jgi:phage virion morphogenesis protein
MAGVHLKWKLQDKEAKSMLKELARRGENARPALTEIGEYLIESTEQRFVDQIDPGGNPWKPLSPKTRKRKKRNADLILVLNQYLSSTLTYQASNDQLEFGSNLIYAATHQFGDDERNIPERPFLGISAADEVEIVAILKDYFQS